MNEPGIMPFRCCMCPQIGSSSTACKTMEPCRFVRSFVDRRGWEYQVMYGKDSTFGICCRAPDQSAWRPYDILPARHTFDEVQQDLNHLAHRKGWRDVGEMHFEDGNPAWL